MKTQRFVCGLPRIEKGELRFSWLLKIEGTKIRFGGLLKNKKELRFELWGFLSLFPSHLPSPLSFFPAISLSLTFVERFLEIFFSFSRFL
ncbi:unnamed protein product [Rhizophagus irregularis]|nr:unnamed protein product [Rhizophagus irregularis]